MWFYVVDFLIFTLFLRNIVDIYHWMCKELTFPFVYGCGENGYYYYFSKLCYVHTDSNKNLKSTISPNDYNYVKWSLAKLYKRKNPRNNKIIIS